MYLLDSNVISDLIVELPPIRLRLAERLAQQNAVAISRPVYYELLRGMFWRGATGKFAALHRRVLPMLSWVTLQDSDWEQAAHFWADATRVGRKLSDPDLLLAALAFRLGAVIVSADTDFDILPVKREDWRVA